MEKNIYNVIREHIKNADIKKAIQEIEIALEKNPHENLAQREFDVLFSRYNDLTGRYIKDLIAHKEYDIYYARIITALSLLLEEYNHIFPGNIVSEQKPIEDYDKIL